MGDTCNSKIDQAETVAVAALSAFAVLHLMLLVVVLFYARMLHHKRQGKATNEGSLGKRQARPRGRAMKYDYETVNSSVEEKVEMV